MADLSMDFARAIKLLNGMSERRRRVALGFIEELAKDNEVKAPQSRCRKAARQPAQVLRLVVDNERGPHAS